MKKNYVVIMTLLISHNLISQCYSKISTKGFHNIAVRSDGSIWCWGNNEYNQIGNNIANNLSPIQIGSSSDFSLVSAGTYNSTAIKNDGTFWYWGRNYYGSAGLPSTPSPQQINSLNNCSTLATGLNNNAVIKSDGTLWVWGWNEYGTNGDGTNTSSSTPIQVGTETNWKSVSIGAQHITAIKTDGSLWAWGSSSNGSIGNNVFSERTTPLRIGNANNWEKTYSGYSSNLAIKSDGSLWAWGWNAYGQLGDGTMVNKITPIQIGNDYDWVDISITTHSLAIKSNGTLWAWGFNNYGKLGLGNSASAILIPTQVGTENNWIKAIAGFEHTIALKDDGTLWAWGRNNFGQLGDGTTVDKAIPTQIEIECSALNQDEFVKDNLVIYPNPVIDILNLKFQNNSKIDKIEIVSLQGNIIQEIKNIQTNLIDLSSISAGFYFLRIYANKKVFYEKLVKN